MCVCVCVCVGGGGGWGGSLYSKVPKRFNSEDGTGTSTY